MPEISFSWLGPIAATIDGRPIKFRTRKAQALLIYLTTESALQGGVPTRRETLLGLFWPNYIERSARQSLRTNLSYLKKGLEEAGDGSPTPFLLSDSQTVHLNPAVPFHLDLAAFSQLLEEYAAHQHETLDACDGCLNRLEHAVELYRGEFLADFYLPDSSPFEAWVSARREVLRRQVLDVLEALTVARLAGAQFEAAERYARRQLEIDPLRETAHQQLIEVLARMGRKPAALAQFDVLKRTFRDELDIEPSLQTQQLSEAVRAGELDERLDEREEEPEIEKEEVKAPVQPVVSTPARPQLVHNLQSQPTPFIGREEELTALGELIIDPQVRLVTILGPGGMGKTRLALAAAEHLVDVPSTPSLFPGGLFFVSLAGEESEEDIVLKIGAALGLQFRGDEEPRQQILDYLSAVKTLLILDNFEHLLASAHLVAAIQKGAPDATIVVTSRERLNISSEALFRLDGMAYPVDARFDESATTTGTGARGAVDLFVHHAKLIQPRLEFDEQNLVDVIQICHLVNGMPLALVLAANWVELLSLDELADAIAGNLNVLESRQRDLPVRQRSIRAAFDTSWQRLSTTEQTVFMKLAAFSGGFSRTAAERVAGANLFVLRMLLEKSLINPVSKDRYELHKLLRQYADEKLVETGMVRAVREAHTRYYLELVCELVADIKGKDQIGALRTIGADLENIRRAWRWGLEQGQLAQIGDGLETLLHYFLISSRPQEGHVMFTQARRTIEQQKEEQLLGRLLAYHGWLRSEYHLDPNSIEADLRQSLEIAERHGHQKEVALARLSLGWYHLRIETAYTAALAEFEAASELFRALNDRFYVAKLLHRIAYCRSSEIEVSASLTRQSLSMALEIGSQYDAHWAQSNLAGYAESLSDLETAELGSRLAQNLAEELELPWLIESGRQNFALIGFLRGDRTLMVRNMPRYLDAHQARLSPLTRAVYLAEWALQAVVHGDTKRAIERSLLSLDLAGNDESILHAHWSLAMAYIDQNAFDKARRHLAAAFNAPISSTYHGLMTRPLPVVAVLLHQGQQSRRAAQILSLARNHPASQTGWIRLWTQTAGLRAEIERALDPGVFLAAWEEGKSLDLLETVAQLMAELGGEIPS